VRVEFVKVDGVRNICTLKGLLNLLHKF
jgi:hypothetical protein